MVQESGYKLRTQGLSYRCGFLFFNQVTLHSLPGGKHFSWPFMLHYKICWLSLKHIDFSKPLCTVGLII